MVDFNPETQYVLRNNCESYAKVPENQKKTITEQITISFTKADPTKTKTTQYDAFGVKDAGTTTTYYDKDGKKLGEHNIWQDGDRKSQSIKTADADYYDWDNNGTIDSKNTDAVYEKKDLEEAITRDRQMVEEFMSRHKLTPSDLTRGDVMSKFVQEYPVASAMALLTYQSSGQDFKSNFSTPLKNILPCFNQSFDNNTSKLGKN